MRYIYICGGMIEEKFGSFRCNVSVENSWKCFFSLLNEDLCVF